MAIPNDVVLAEGDIILIEAKVLYEVTGTPDVLVSTSGRTWDSFSVPRANATWLRSALTVGDEVCDAGLRDAGAPRGIVQAIVGDRVWVAWVQGDSIEPQHTLIRTRTRQDVADGVPEGSREGEGA